MILAVIICTYNRPAKIRTLVDSLKKSIQAGTSIIVVDSSDEVNVPLKKDPEVIYLRSNHKNQPYQRLVGYDASKADYLLFLDDDMELEEKDFFVQISKVIQEYNPAGLAINFEDKHANTTLANVPKSKLFGWSKTIGNLKSWLTGNKKLKEGEFGLCGNRGKQPKIFAQTEYVSGGAFIAKRSALFENFNFQLFDLFEERMGMGEDGLIGYGLSKMGKVYFRPEISFLHNDQGDSSYSAKLEGLAKRVLFSRLYLSLEKQRYNKGSIMFAKVHFHYYAFFRLMGIFANRMISPSEDRKKTFRGAFAGWKATLKFKYFKNLEANEYWLNELNENKKELE